MSNIIKAKKGFIQVLVNPLTKQFELIDPSDLNIIVGRIENGKVKSGSPYSLGLFLSKKDLEIQNLKEDYKKLNEEYLKFKDDSLKAQSDNLILFNKMNNTIETLLKKITKLENEVTTLLSINTNKE